MQRVILHGLIVATAAVAVVVAAVAFGKALNQRGVFLEYNPPAQEEPILLDSDQVGLLIEEINAVADAGEDIELMLDGLKAGMREAAAEALEFDDIVGE